MTIAAAQRRHPGAILLLAAVGLLAPAHPASAAVDTFVRFEENATANWTVVQDCGDGRTATTRVTVIAGREIESPDLDDESTFATVLIRGVDCEGDLVSARGSGDVTYTSSPSLRDAHVTGTIPLNTGGQATIDVTWEGTGGIETTTNQTKFDGFVGVFTGKERKATATGTVVVDGVTLVSGPSQSATLETLEDRNITLP